MNLPVEGIFIGKTFSNALFECSSDHGKNTMQNDFCEHMYVIEGFKYVSNGVSSSRKSMVCSKRFRKKCSPGSRKRQRDIHRRIHCNGLITFSYKKNQFYIRLKHDEHHQGDSRIVSITDEMKSKIKRTLNLEWLLFRKWHS